MTDSDRRVFRLPVEDELDLHRLKNAAGIEISVLPNGCVFAIEHRHGADPTLINQVFGSPLGSGIGRVLLRLGAERMPFQIAGPGANGRVGASTDRFVWEGDTNGLRHRVTLWLHPRQPVWLWRIDLENSRPTRLDCDIILIQDLGLGARSGVLSNEAYLSQYIDHTVGRHRRFGPVVMSRQNMEQFGRNPWVAHGCLDGAASFATDAAQIFGPAFRGAAECEPGFGTDLPGIKIQREAACAAIRSRAIALAPGATGKCTFFGLYNPHHAAATANSDLARLDAAEDAERDFQTVRRALAKPQRSILQDSAPLAGLPLTDEVIAQSFPERMHEEWRDGTLLSFFTPDGPLNRHIVLAPKVRLVRRRHGAILRGGNALLPDDRALSATCWMHGVFAAQLTIGNTALHKLFSVSRDPFNITRASGLRILVDRGDGWRLLTVPSLFEMGLNDCRWLYATEDGAIEVHAIVSAEDTAMQWHITASGAPCRFLIFGHLVMGEHDFRHPASVEVNGSAKRISVRPDADWLWGQKYPEAVHHLVTSTPGAVEAIGGGALLFEGTAPRAADAYIAIKTEMTDRFSFALVGALNDPGEAARLAAIYERPVDTQRALDQARRFWGGVTRNIRFSRADPDAAALDTIFPWFVQNAMVHLSVPRGLEQYSAAAWGTRDVCQGPVECLLMLGHSEAVRDILRIVFAQQYELSGDWPQWFMLDPYGQIRDRHSHGDVIVWPLKALCDYLEVTGNRAFLTETVPWTRDDFEKTAHGDTIADHVEKLLATVRERFIPGTHLIRYGLGDWNDSMQPADPAMRDWMVSSWTVALLYQQISRYARILTETHDADKAEALLDLAACIRKDFKSYLMPGGTVAGYALFKPEGGEPEWLLHPSDTRTGLHYSLIPMTRSIIAGLFSFDETRHHLELIREHLMFPDGARLMDRPVTYSGGAEVNFRRAESAAFFGREIGLMYSHAHLRYCEALGVIGELDALRDNLRAVNPIAVTDSLSSATLRQRNAYFSSSDAAFRDREQASAEWARVKDGTVAVDGGWRVYSSGPGIFIRLVLQYLSAMTEPPPGE